MNLRNIYIHLYILFLLHLKLDIKQKKLNTVTEGKSSKEKSIYVKVSDETRGIIDKHKEQEKMTISQIIADSIMVYDQYKSMAPEVRAIISNNKDEYGGGM